MHSDERKKIVQRISDVLNRETEELNCLSTYDLVDRLNFRVQTLKMQIQEQKHIAKTQAECVLISFNENLKKIEEGLLKQTNEFAEQKQKMAVMRQKLFDKEQEVRLKMEHIKDQDKQLKEQKLFQTSLQEKLTELDNELQETREQLFEKESELQSINQLNIASDKERSCLQAQVIEMTRKSNDLNQDLEKKTKYICEINLQMETLEENFTRQQLVLSRYMKQVEELNHLKADQSSQPPPQKKKPPSAQ